MSEAKRGGASGQGKSERLLAGRYRLGEVLGRGGMGTVWRAKDETLGRTVAVKELRFPSSIDEEEKRRLITRTLREAKAIARIRNNGAVTVFDVVDEDDRPWIVMELIEGKSLAEAIREDGLLSPRRAAEVGLAVLDVLRAAHREGILHRDVKPSNVLIAEDGRVVLTDFGIAQVEGDPSITSTGMLVGAPSYISPERARGHRPGRAADLWSLGGLLYASVEGVPPYDKGSAIATLTAVMTEPLERPKNAGPLEKVIYGLLLKDPHQRLDDAGARAMLNEVIHAPEAKETEPEPADATKAVPLPEVPDVSDAPADKGSSGRKTERRSGSKGNRTSKASRKGEAAAERLRGAFRSVRKGAAEAAGAATAAAGTRGKPDSPDSSESSSGSSTSSSSSESPSSSESSAEVAASAASQRGGASQSAVSPGAAFSDTASSGAQASVGDKAGASAGPARDSATAGLKSTSDGTPGTGGGTPPRMPPRAPLTDVVSRRALVIAAVVVVLTVLGTVLAVTLADNTGAKGKGGDTDSASSGATAGSDTKQDESGSTDTDGGEKTDIATGDATRVGTPSASASGRSSGSEEGSGKGADDVAVTPYKGSQGFRIGLPEGWKHRSTSAAGARFTGPEGQKLLVAWTSTPKGDPVADWKNQERYMRRSQYDRIRIEKVEYRGWKAADWEFTYVESGTRYRTIDRGFVVNDQLGCALMYTAKASGWSRELRKDTWRTLAKTFKPKS